MNINLIYIYPKVTEINNEINLLRIIDKKLKESLVFYSVKDGNIHKVYLINTMSGEVIHFINYNDKNSLNNLINNIKIKEEEIKNLNNLEIIEKYILKTMKN